MCVAAVPYSWARGKDLKKISYPVRTRTSFHHSISPNRTFLRISTEENMDRHRPQAADAQKPFKVRQIREIACCFNRTGFWECSDNLSWMWSELLLSILLRAGGAIVTKGSRARTRERKIKRCTNYILLLKPLHDVLFPYCL